MTDEGRWNLGDVIIDVYQVEKARVRTRVNSRFEGNFITSVSFIQRYARRYVSRS